VVVVVVVVKFTVEVLVLVSVVLRVVVDVLVDGVTVVVVGSVLVLDVYKFEPIARGIVRARLTLWKS
jgi:hypothetical protein